MKLGGGSRRGRLRRLCGQQLNIGSELHTWTLKVLLDDVMNDKKGI
jgi:hypothetical protein